ncbi:hypothetical protein [Maritimibacter sp. DP1N21-5]|uniref:hypothetical protein n=1 Tax=Maritimibacter sp. DP1N21-5 TaxID=2836867 RepID=UPI001C47A435|nr:hypothetical protein [Maritimibacter sp. DP1N21-5]MBV7410956.1 hypothetical protein [Maritimibacter sp. DP1N21-5]
MLKSILTTALITLAMPGTSVADETMDARNTPISSLDFKVMQSKDIARLAGDLTAFAKGERRAAQDLAMETITHEQRFGAPDPKVRFVILADLLCEHCTTLMRTLVTQSSAFDESGIQIVLRGIPATEWGTLPLNGLLYCLADGDGTRYAQLFTHIGDNIADLAIGDNLAQFFTMAGFSRDHLENCAGHIGWYQKAVSDIDNFIAGCEALGCNRVSSDAASLQVPVIIRDDSPRGVGPIRFSAVGIGAASFDQLLEEWMSKQ